MRSIRFDARGYLQPEGLIELTVEEFEDLFVSQFEDFRTRRSIFDNFKRYNQDLKEVIGIEFIQWIDGSFVSNKEHPNDLDFITFIEWQNYSQYEKEIDNRFSKWSVGRYYENLDAYTISEYPEGHRFYQTFLADRAYWYEWFSNSQYNRAKKRFSKGFVQIKTT